MVKYKLIKDIEHPTSPLLNIPEGTVFVEFKPGWYRGLNPNTRRWTPPVSQEWIDNEIYQEYFEPTEENEATNV